MLSEYDHPCPFDKLFSYTQFMVKGFIPVTSANLLNLLLPTNGGLHPSV